jgi:hypothetical protein
MILDPLCLHSCCSSARTTATGWRPTADYDVLTGDATGREVAFIISDDEAVLAAEHERHPQAKPVLIVDRGDWSAGHLAIAAIALGRIDYHLYRPRQPLERILYALVIKFLAAWESTRTLGTAAVFRIAGNRTRPRPTTCGTS